MASKEFCRPDPEELLRQITAQEAHEARGRLKIFLGYAPRVGKSLRMFDEGRRRKKRGQDVVIGAIQRKGLDDIGALIKEFEVIPPLRVGDADTIDVDAILRRAPQVCLVDELARDNPPGSRYPHRWQEVEEIRAHGVNVVSAINLQHICEQQDAVQRITGRRSANFVPQSFIQTADEIVLVDVPAEDLHAPWRHEQSEPRAAFRTARTGLAAGRAGGGASAAALHGLARHPAKLGHAGAHPGLHHAAQQRANMLESGARAAQRFHGQLLAVYVKQGELTREAEETVEENLEFARKLGAEVHVHRGRGGKDPIAEIIQFAREQRITQVFIGHTQQSCVEVLGPAARSID